MRYFALASRARMCTREDKVFLIDRRQGLNITDLVYIYALRSTPFKGHAQGIILMPVIDGQCMRFAVQI